MPAHRGLTLREQRFVTAYLGPSNGNSSLAAKAAGYSTRSPQSLRQTASQLLTKPHIIHAIAERERKRAQPAILSAEARDTLLSQMAKNPLVPFATQVAAVKELNKCSGRHSIKHVMDVTEKLSDIIAASREPVS